MLERLAILAILAIALGGVAAAWAGARARRLARERLGEEVERFAADPEPDDELEEDEPTPIFRSRRWIPWAAGLGLAVILKLAGLGWSYAPMFGGLVGLLVHEVQSALVVRRRARIEAQLADAIDLMIAGLRAGGGVMNSLEAATLESRTPLRPQFEEVLGRIRYGDDPRVVYKNLTIRVPLETFRLFASAMSVQHEVGGALAPTLGVVGRIIRDRIDLARRIRSLTVQAKASIFAILGTTYFILIVLYLTDPDRMRGFLASTIGSAAFAFCVMLQGVGIVWSSALSRLKY